MNIDLARTFLEVVSAGSMSVAAERLNVTHSTVTVRIKTLEDILRRRVLERSRSGVALTADGERFLEFAEALVRTWQITRRHMSLASGFESVLSVGIDRTLWDGLMSQWAIKTRRAKPGTALLCETDTSARLIERLFSGWLDMVIVYEPQTRSGFRAEPLFDDPLTVLATVAREGRSDWDPDFVAIDYGPAVKYQQDMIWGQFDETPHISANDLSMGLECLASFGGSILAPARLLERDDLPCKLYPVADQPVISREAYMLYSPDALKMRMRRVPLAKLRASLINQFIGKHDIWEE